MDKDRPEYTQIVAAIEALERRTGVGRAADAASIEATHQAFETLLAGYRDGRPEAVNHPLGPMLEALAGDGETPQPSGSYDVDPFSAGCEARFEQTRRFLDRYADVEHRLHTDKAAWRLARAAQRDWAAATRQVDPYAERLRPWLRWQRAMREWGRTKAEAERRHQAARRTRGLA
jgi:hypothetical protein